MPLLSRRRAARLALTPISVAAIFTSGLALLLAPLSSAFAGSTSNASAPRARSVLLRGLPYGRFVVHGSHGYTLTVEGLPHSARLIAARGGRATEYVDFGGRGSPSGIEARFPRRGRVSVKFHPNGRHPTRPLSGELAHCHPLRPRTEQLGAFSGRIEFHGEHGFTRVRLRHASGRAGFARIVRCHESRKVDEWAPGESGGPAVELHPYGGVFYAGSRAFSRFGLGDGLLGASVRRPSGEGVQFGVRVTEFGFTQITRLAFARGAPRSLLVNQKAQSARIRPPWPFANGAVVRDCPTPPRWSGGLSVHFPGKTVRLAPPSGKSALAIPGLFPAPWEGCGTAVLP